MALRGELYHRMDAPVNSRDSRSTPTLIGQPVRRADTHSAMHRYPRAAALEPQFDVNLGQMDYGRGRERDKACHRTARQDDQIAGNRAVLAGDLEDGNPPARDEFNVKR